MGVIIRCPQTFSHIAYPFKCYILRFYLICLFLLVYVHDQHLSHYFRNTTHVWEIKALSCLVARNRG